MELPASSSAFVKFDYEFIDELGFDFFDVVGTIFSFIPKKNKKKIQLVWSIAGAISFGRLRHFSPTLFLNLKEKTKNKKNSGAWQFGGKK
jgi:hypothetical protein